MTESDREQRVAESKICACARVRMRVWMIVHVWQCHAPAVCHAPTVLYARGVSSWSLFVKRNVVTFSLVSYLGVSHSCVTVVFHFNRRRPASVSVTTERIDVGLVRLNRKAQRSRSGHNPVL